MSQKPTSAYEISNDIFEPHRHVLSVIVDNESGVLARVVGLFSGRGYNIESLTVTSITEDDAISRITIVTSGNDKVINQIKTLLLRLVPVHDVHDLTTEGPSIEKEMCLIKLKAVGENRIEALRIADIFGATVSDTTRESYVFHLASRPSKCQAFINIMRDLGELEVAKSGIVAMARGACILSSNQYKNT